ncbi:MAG: hypothetical protein U0325_00570 [Polyangiales bacterium]
MTLRAILACTLLLGCGQTAVTTDASTADAALADAGPPTWESVQAILARSCAFSSCHGATRAFPRLSAELAYASLTTSMSMQVTSLRLVTPGDPAQSWLMNKLDGTMSTRAACAASAMTCGTSMPQSSELLPAHEREMIRAWIRMGAMGPRDN